MSTIQSTRLGGDARYLKIWYDVTERKCDSRNPCQATEAETGRINWRTMKKENDGAGLKPLTGKSSKEFGCDCNTGKQW